MSPMSLSDSVWKTWASSGDFWSSLRGSRREICFLWCHPPPTFCGWGGRAGSSVPLLFWVSLARHFSPPFSGTGVQRQGPEERLRSPVRDRLCVLCRTSCGGSSFLSREKRRRGRRWPCSLAFPLGMLVGGQGGLAQREAQVSSKPGISSCLGTASTSACRHGRSAITGHALLVTRSFVPRCPLFPSLSFAGLWLSR